MYKPGTRGEFAPVQSAAETSSSKDSKKVDDDDDFLQTKQAET